MSTDVKVYARCTVDEGQERRIKLVIEIPPRVSTVRSNARQGPLQDERIYQIPFPYVIAIIDVDTHTLQLYARTSPMTAEDETLFSFYMPHCGNGHVCYYPVQPLAGFTELQRALHYINEYFTTTFSYFIGSTPPVEVETALLEVHGLNQYAQRVDRYFEFLEGKTVEEIMAFTYPRCIDLDELLGERFATTVTIERFAEEKKYEEETPV